MVSNFLKITKPASGQVRTCTQAFLTTSTQHTVLSKAHVRLLTLNLSAHASSDGSCLPCTSKLKLSPIGSFLQKCRISLVPADPLPGTLTMDLIGYRAPIYFLTCSLTFFLTCSFFFFLSGVWGERVGMYGAGKKQWRRQLDN